MRNCSDDLLNYEKDKVKLTSDQRAQLRERRDANRDRIRNGLKKEELPEPKTFVPQGSDAMQTTIQEPDNDYDIDDGVVFTAESLQGSRGADKAALEARQMIRDVVDDGSFKTPPEVKTNCVRVHYSDGPHVDIPVYRETSVDENYELASADWKESDPEGVNGWFRDSAGLAGEKGRTQIKRIIRLLKAFCMARQSYALPSGFVLTVLVLEQYGDCDERLDRALRHVLEGVHDRLDHDLHVRHPVVDEWLIDDGSASKTEKLRDLLSSAIKEMEGLDLPSCSQSRGLKVWKKIFLTDYFDDEIANAEEDERAKTAAAVVSSGTVVKPYAPVG